MARARSVEEFVANMMGGAPAEPNGYVPYEPQAGDVFITSWAKSGTTLMQQMFHQLRTGGDMDFDDISGVVPWDDVGAMIEFDMTAPQRADPRGFKSHREYERLPAGMRYVVTLRDPKEAYVSFYRFLNGWHIERGAVRMEDFLPIWMSGGPGGCDYFTHLLSWFARRHEADSLVTSYRWAVKNKRAMIERMAALCDVNLTEELAALVEERTSREFMHDHLHMFDDKLVATAWEAKAGIPAASDSTKVQSSGSNASDLPDATAAQIDAMWAERVTPITGHASFAELEAELIS